MEHSCPDQNAEKGTPLDLRRLATVLAAGFFSTTLAQPEVIELPLQGLLKEVLHLSEPIRKVWIHSEAFAASRLSMMRIMARRMNAATVVA